ncbi:hypothetical protein ACLOJK_027995, partial [Asimina triloba]
DMELRALSFVHRRYDMDANDGALETNEVVTVLRRVTATAGEGRGREDEGTEVGGNEKRGMDAAETSETLGCSNSK